MELYNLTIHELHDMLKKGDTTSEAITESVLGRIKAVDGKVKAYITVTEEIARAQAREADKRIKAGDTSSPLLGIPIAVKDNRGSAWSPTRPPLLRRRFRRCW